MSDDTDNLKETAAEGLDDALSEPDAEFGVATAAPANSRTILLAGVIILGLVGLYFTYLRKGPAGAEASAESAAADATISQFLNDGPKSIQLMEELRRNTEQVVERFQTYPSQTQVPLSDLRTNPFQFIEDKPDSANLSEAAARRQREELRQSALAGVQNLQLQSIMYGDAGRACMINNALVREGQQVEAFTVEKISADAVVVRSGSYRFELRMQRAEKPVLRH